MAACDAPKAVCCSVDTHAYPASKPSFLGTLLWCKNDIVSRFGSCNRSHLSSLPLEQESFLRQHPRLQMATATLQAFSNVACLVMCFRCCERDSLEMVSENSAQAWSPGSRPACRSLVLCDPLYVVEGFVEPSKKLPVNRPLILGPAAVGPGKDFL